MAKEPLKILVVDCVEKDTLPLGGVEGWFRAALKKCDPGVEVKTVRASAQDWEKEVAWADAVMISGSPRDAFAEDEWTHALMAKVARLLEKKKPVLGVCYGHQILGRANGAKVERCEGGWELGENQVQITGEGASSPLLEGLPKQMNVMQSHRDCVLEVPGRGVLLASSPHTKVQAARWAERAYGVQFHPEFTGEVLRGVWTERRDKWRGEVKFDLDQTLDQAKECPDGLAIFRNFLKMIRSR
jgi:GMP synthase (glutamine-hydrolysing)